MIALTIRVSDDYSLDEQFWEYFRENSKDYDNRLKSNIIKNNIFDESSICSIYWDSCYRFNYNIGLYANRNEYFFLGFASYLKDLNKINSITKKKQI